MYGESVRKGIVLARMYTTSQSVRIQIQGDESHTVQPQLSTHRVFSGFIKLYSRSYAEDVTSVTSGASQGPHSFNLVFVCVFVCVTPGAIHI